MSVCMCVFPIERLYEVLTECFMVESYVIFPRKLMLLFSFRSRSTLGVYGPNIYRPPKTAFNNSEPIAMKFDIEIVCTQEIIMGYVSLDKFFKKRGLGDHPPPPNKQISFFLRLYEALTEYFMIKSYVSFLEKANDATFILIEVHFGGLRAHNYRSPKTTFNNCEPIAMQFDIEIVCTQKIIMGYVSLEIFSKKGVLGGTPQPISFFLRLYEELTEYFMIDSNISFLEKATDTIFILIKVHFGGLQALYLQDILKQHPIIMNRLQKNSK